jgi:hypothetical protein
MSKFSYVEDLFVEFYDQTLLDIEILQDQDTSAMHSFYNQIQLGNQLTANQSGGNATLISTVDAAGTRQVITTSGGTGNSVTTNLTGDNGNVNIGIVGATNTISVAQSDAGGSTGHQAVMDIVGTGNSVTLAQSGSAQANVFNLKVGAAGSAANSNTYNITQTAR